MQYAKNKNVKCTWTVIYPRITARGSEWKPSISLLKPLDFSAQVIDVKQHHGSSSRDLKQWPVIMHTMQPSKHTGKDGDFIQLCLYGYGYMAWIHRPINKDSVQCLHVLPKNLIINQFK
jgi:hypothetical protein